MDFQLKEAYAHIDDAVQKNIIDKFNLQPNFDIKELLRSLDIDTIPIPYRDNSLESLYCWDYSFKFSDDNIKICYRDLKSELLREKLMDYLKHDPELLFRQFHYTFDDTNEVIKLEKIDKRHSMELFKLSDETIEDIRRQERVILARALGELVNFCFNNNNEIDYDNLIKTTYKNQDFYHGYHKYYDFKENTCLVFSAALLMPYITFTEQFYTLAEDIGDVSSVIEQLSNQFGVSYKLAHDRCKVLSLIKTRY